MSRSSIKRRARRARGSINLAGDGVKRSFSSKLPHSSMCAACCELSRFNHSLLAQLISREILPSPLRSVAPVARRVSMNPVLVALCLWRPIPIPTPFLFVFFAFNDPMCFRSCLSLPFLPLWIRLPASICNECEKVIMLIRLVIYVCVSRVG